MADDQDSDNILTLTDDEQQVLDLWLDCGLAEVLANAQGSNPIKFYLEHMPDAHMSQTLLENLGRPLFTHFTKQLSRAAYNHLSAGCAQSFNCMMRNVHGVIAQKCLRWVLLHNPTHAHLDIDFSPGHPSFADESARWSKVATLLALDNFPLKVDYWQKQHITWWTHYQMLAQKHGDIVPIRKMRISLLRCESSKHGRMMMQHRSWLQKLNPDSYGGKKYFELRSNKRLSMLRFYLYQCGAGVS